MNPTQKYAIIEQMGISFASAVGIPSKTSWTSTLTLRNNGAGIYGVFSFFGDEKSPQEGRKFVRVIEEGELSAPVHFYEALQKAVTGVDPQTQLSASFIWQKEEKIYIFTFGNGVVGLVRENSQRWLMDGNQEKMVLEGELHDQDLLVLATGRAREIPLVLENYQGSDPDSLVAQLFTRVQQHPSSGEISLLFLQNMQKNAEKVIKAPEETPIVVARPPAARMEEEPPVHASHLIDPAKLLAGVAAAQKVPPPRRQKTATDRFLDLPFKQKIILISAVIFFFLFIFFSAAFYRARLIEGERNEVLVPLQENFQQIRSQGQDRLQQRDQTQSLLERVQSTKLSYGTNRQELKELQEQVQEYLGQISGEKDVVNLNVFYDFRLVSADFLASKASRSEDVAVFLDTAAKKLIRLNLLTKSNETLSSEGLNDVRDLATNETQASVVDGKMLKNIPLNGAKPEESGELADVQEANIIDSFGENLYVLDRASQQLWRAPIVNEATASGWIRSARGVEFSSIASMSIDGSVWLGSQDGMIYKLTRGERENFSPTGLLEPFTDSLIVATIAEGNKLVVVEPSRQRVVVMDKSGTYQQQISSPQIGAVTDAFLDQEEKVVFLVAGSVVYRVEI